MGEGEAGGQKIQYIDTFFFIITQTLCGKTTRTTMPKKHTKLFYTEASVLVPNQAG